MNEEVATEDMLRPYRVLIDNFNDDQKVEWARWSGRLPHRVSMVAKQHIDSKKKVEFWQNLTYIFVILSACVPVIVTILVEIFAWSHVASLLDVVFPTMVGVIQVKLSTWSKKKHAYSSLYSPYLRLLADIIVDISNGNYTLIRKKFEERWEELDQFVVRAGLY